MSLSVFYNRLCELTQKVCDLLPIYAEDFNDEHDIQREFSLCYRVLGCNKFVFDQVEIGNGRVDLMIVYLMNKIAVEIKLSSNSNYKKGISYQLPEYMKRMNCSEGIFILAINSSKKSIKQFQKLIDDEKSEEFQIKTFYTDIRPQIQPSKKK